jgi:hypothetical protein
MPSVPITVYVEVEVGVTLNTGVELNPGNQVYDVAPVANKVVPLPLQIFVAVGVIPTTIIGDTLTEATAVAVQVPVPDNTE